VATSRPLSEIDDLIGEGFDPQPSGQRPGQDETGMGHHMVVIEGHVEPVESVGRSHLKSAFLSGTNPGFANRIIPCGEALLAVIHNTKNTLGRPSDRWIEAKCHSQGTVDADFSLGEAGMTCSSGRIPAAFQGCWICPLRWRRVAWSRRSR
jgi:hypothetical protein